jgi:hypothetical protein
MKRETANKKERSTLLKQFGTETIMPQQMGDITMSSHEHENAKDNLDRGLQTEDRGYTVQMS